MRHPRNPADVFISYASADRERVRPITDRLVAAGVSVWVDREAIDGGTRWAEEIVRGIQGCRVVVLMCSDGSMRSWAVKQEIQLAGECEKALLPMMLEPTSFPDQMRFFLAGRQWIEIMNRPEAEWLPRMLRALVRANVAVPTAFAPGEVDEAIEPLRLEWSLAGLRRLARFTDQIWPVPADVAPTPPAGQRVRDLGAPQDRVEHGHRLGSRVRLALESDRDGQLLLIDEGPSGTIYCLCPSRFMPDTKIRAGRTYLPSDSSGYGSFVVSGLPGREQLLAIISADSLGFDWMPSSPDNPARILSAVDVNALLDRLRTLPGDRWVALASYFDVVA